MAMIPREALDYLTQEINGISSEAQERVTRVLSGITWTPETIADCRNVVLLALQEVLPTYSELAAQASADFYDAARTACVGSPMGAVPVSGYDQSLTDRAVRAFVQGIVDGSPIEQFNDAVLQRIDYEMKRSAGSTMFENGRRDPVRPRFARVPTGPETCDFCLMLASRGFVYTSESAASNNLDHYHSGCDCRVVAGWDGAEVEGYDTTDLYHQWQDAVDAMAKERAERKGTSVEEERAAIMRGYRNSASHAKRAGKSTA